jgi:hypothetical protein
MMYTLKAELNKFHESIKIVADNNSDAHWKSMKFILDNAYTDKEGVWAKGKIVLSDASGNVVNDMKQK